MKKILTLSFFILHTCLLFSQNTPLTGVVTDGDTKEPLIGASVVIKGTSIGAITDIDGRFTLQLPKGKNTIDISFVGYSTKDVAVDGTNTTLDVALSPSIALKEVVITSDIAIERKTPVAFSNISAVRLKEELASQDLPMLLNSIPGAYATQSGGGDGDARVTIRGFNQRNVAVLLDGVPVNDMENGQVFWSNWFGLGQVTKQMQVQRGLGASKLSIPSVGGSIGIYTKGIESKKEISLKQEVGIGNYYQTSLGFNSGKLKNGFGVTGAFAYKTNEGWVERLYSKAYFYFVRIDKEFGNHLVSLSGFGGPQEHGQRPFSQSIALTSVQKARELGFTDAQIKAQDTITGAARGVDRGLQFNDSWGVYNGVAKNTRLNYYHKPQFTLKHSWQINPKTF